MTQKHTPTPWGVQGDTYVTINSLIIAHCKQDGHTTLEEAQANAAFIVRAVNSHDALVRAVEIGLRYAPKELGLGRKIMEEALALAKEKVS